ncbi:hypothetical protein EGX84_14660 [Acinetobacter baumannii]|nr:hypothetical protein [Acinetobacter baumannii]AYX87689.1 hypothetical protein EGX84_14660 [Acinetobacter baumannii]
MEPVSTSGLTAILKFYGAAIMVTLAVALVAAVVLMTRMPRSPQDEPYRVCRRVNILRDYPDDKTKLYPRN